ncbi:MAG: DUF971 domain-containing protein [Ignavibacteria bacterium]|nr:DUF971 domain-containing protein [Ignavibacteria bacterium]
MIPRKVHLSPHGQLLIEWSDGHESSISLRTLREMCPCASCQGETVLLHHFPPTPQPDLPGKYSLRGAEQVGSYALQLTWGDGHSTGLYSWEYLKSLCECDQCRT